MHLYGNASRPTFIFAGIHGDEPTSTYVAQQLMAYLEAHPRAYAGTAVAILPAANPDGLKKGTRTNSNGVDVNRNFPAKNWKLARRKTQYYGGKEAGCEPETRVIVRAVERLNPARIISIHSIKRGKHCNNYDGPAAGLAKMMERFNGYPAKASIGYPTPGSFGSWAGIDRGIPTITLELPDDLPGPQCWKENRAALLAVIRAGASSTGE